jgi:hypothetical protein
VRPGHEGAGAPKSAGLVARASEIDVHPGLLTTVLAETLPRPRATVSEIVDVVEAFDKDSDPGYAGHDAGSVGSLFPSIRAFSGLDLADEETWRIFFLLCLDEVMRGETWIEESFANTLRAIAELGSIDVPYKTLCRSIFDADPAAMFLALYRCIESLYAYSSAREIMKPSASTMTGQMLRWSSKISLDGIRARKTA